MICRNALVYSLFALFALFMFAPAALADGTVAMYRMYNPNSGEHFYTADVNERNGLISSEWGYEEIGWPAPGSSGIPVYRLYNANGGEHHYTVSANERDALLGVGWSDEGIGWYSDEAKALPLYREYNPNAFANNHNYTTDTSEHEYLLSIGWRDEGVAWYGVRWSNLSKAAINESAKTAAYAKNPSSVRNIDEKTHNLSEYAELTGEVQKHVGKYAVSGATANVYSLDLPGTFTVLGTKYGDISGNKIILPETPFSAYVGKTVTIGSQYGIQASEGAPSHDISMIISYDYNRMPTIVRVFD